MAVIDATTRFVLDCEEEGRRRERAGESLLSFVPRVSRDYVSPAHLAPLATLLERTEHEQVFATVHAPPRHGKTDLVLHAIARRLARQPTTRVGFASYAARLARNKSRRAMQLAERAGVGIDPQRRAAHEWATTAGGVVFSAGRGGPFTGEGFDLIVVDDPIKNRAEAESRIVRESLRSWFDSTVRTRLEPGGSILVVATRWHEDDLAGQLGREGWESVTLPALGDDGHALWPERWPAEVLEQTREQVGAREWWSLFQGRPRAKHGEVFRGVHFYDRLPDERYRLGGGLDFAYTRRTSADYSVLVEGRAVGDVLYLTDVDRRQVGADEWRHVLRARRENGAARASWGAFVSGVEKGVVEMMDVGIEAYPASSDKLARAQSVAADWNAGRVLVPREAPWLDAFIAEVLDFTGVGDRHDDQVDALAGLHRAVVEHQDDAPTMLRALARM